MARKMKDSGIPWVGKIPEDWEVTRLKYQVSTREEKGNFVSSRDKYIGLENVASNCGGYIETDTEYLDAYYDICKKGDLLYSRLRPYLAKCIVAPFDGFCTGEFLNICSCKCNKSFLRYWLVSPAATNEINASTYGAKMPRADKTFIMNLSFLLPPLSEQKRIAEYLDKTVGRIDGLREKISREIERLGDYKKLMISEAVCRGLDKTAKMKDSGIPWVGKIPAGWEVKKIASLYSLRNQKVSEKDYPALSVSKMGVIPQLEHVAKSNDLDNRKLVREGDFAINSRSDRRGACGIARQDGSVSLINIVLKPRESMSPDYFDWLFHSTLFADEFYKWGSGIDADVWSTHWKMMKKICVPFPPLAEQKRIAEYIDKQVAKIDALIEKRKAELERLEALKRSIICECVTGKKEVAA